MGKSDWVEVRIDGTASRLAHLNKKGEEVGIRFGDRTVWLTPESFRFAPVRHAPEDWYENTIVVRRRTVEILLLTSFIVREDPYGEEKE